MFSWTASVLIYYGLTFEAGKLGGNATSIYVTEGYLGLAECPAFFACYFIVDMKGIGRRGTLALSYLLSGFALLALAALPRDSMHDMVPPALAVIGKFGACGAFCVLYIYTSELFPTTVRGTAMGLFNFGGRLGGMASPLMNDLPVSLCLGVFSAFSFVGCGLVLTLRDTLGEELQETVAGPGSKKEGMRSGSIKVV
jgi:OCT family organic cation transporter-like MFS transporter 4/5